MKYSDVVYGNYLKHYGVIGMKWGIRRFQNEDGSLTNAGEERYRSRKATRLQNKYDKLIKLGKSGEADKINEKLQKQNRLDRYYEQEYNKAVKGKSGFQKTLMNLGITSNDTSNATLKARAKLREKNKGKNVTLSQEVSLAAKQSAKTHAAVTAGLASAFLIKSGIGKALARDVMSSMINKASAMRAARQAAEFIPKIADYTISYVADASEYIVR